VGPPFGEEFRPVCDACAEKHRPDLVRIRKEAKKYVAAVVEERLLRERDTTRNKLKRVFRETIEERVLRAVSTNEPEPDEEIPF